MVTVFHWMVAILTMTAFLGCCLLFPRWARNVLVALDQLASAILWGDPDETISSRLGKAQRGDHGRLVQWLWTPAAWLVNILFYPLDGWGHCWQCIEEDEGRAAVFQGR